MKKGSKSFVSLILVLLFVLGTMPIGFAEEGVTYSNVAAGRSAWAGSFLNAPGSHGVYPASNAVDGDFTNFYINAGIGTDQYQFWAVDLGQSYTIDKVEFTMLANREVSERSNFKIQVANDRSFSDAVDITDYYTDACSDTTTVVPEGLTEKYRYVRFIKKTVGDPYLCIAEVLVLTTDTPGEMPQKIGVQDYVCSDGWYMDPTLSKPEFVFDGNTGTGWMGNNEIAWITLDLGENYYRYDITEILFTVGDQNYWNTTPQSCAEYKIELSNDPNFEEDVQLVFNNTTQNKEVPLSNAVSLSEGVMVYYMNGDTLAVRRAPMANEVNTYRYVRVKAYGDNDTTGTQSPWYPMMVYEVEVYGVNLYGDEGASDTIEVLKSTTDLTPLDGAFVDGRFALRLNIDNSTSGVEKPVKICLAAYETVDGAKRLKSVQMASTAVAPYVMASTVLEMVPQSGKDYKVFAWEGDDITPITPPQTITLDEEYKEYFADRKLDIIILGGQSNAEGNGYGSATDPFVPSENIYRMNRDLSIELADEREAIVNGTTYKVNNFVLRFAERYAENYLEEGRTVLILQAPVGGSGFVPGDWTPDGDYYLTMMKMIQKALSLNPENRLVAFLWHQGERDISESAGLNWSAETSFTNYYHYLDTMVKGVRTTFGVNDLPFIAGDYADKVKEFTNPWWEPVTAANEEFATLPNNGFVSAAGLKVNSEIEAPGAETDMFHFCREDLNTLGERYFEKYQEILATQSAN